MKFKISDLTHADMALYFKGCYVRLLGPNDTFVGWMKYHGHNGDGHVFEGPQGTVSLSASSSKTHTIDCTFPYGYRNCLQGAMHFRRLPTKQNYKGLSFGHNIEGVGIESILHAATDFKEDKEVAQSVTKHAARYHYTIASVNEMFTSKFSGIQDAYQAIRDRKNMGRAISEDFCMTPNPSGPGCQVFYHHLPVGAMEDRYRIKCLIPEFNQELQDFFYRKGVRVA